MFWNFYNYLKSVALIKTWDEDTILRNRSNPCRLACFSYSRILSSHFLLDGKKGLLVSDLYLLLYVWLTHQIVLHVYLEVHVCASNAMLYLQSMYMHAFVSHDKVYSYFTAKQLCQKLASCSVVWWKLSLKLWMPLNSLATV